VLFCVFVLARSYRVAYGTPLDLDAFLQSIVS